jgi:TM2 domain-containing membrane protein YozV
MSSPESIPPAELPPPPPPPTVVAPAPVLPVRIDKSPWVSLLLSMVLPGLGQLYNGQVAKGLTFFSAFSGCIYLIVEDHPMPFAVFLPFILFWNMIDAYRSATAINLRGTAAALEDDGVESPGWGIGIAVIGALLLLNNLGWLRLGALVPYWPVLLIAAGLALLRKATTRKAV